MRIYVDFDEEDLQPALQLHLTDGISMADYVISAVKLLNTARNTLKTKEEQVVVVDEPQYRRGYHSQTLAVPYRR